MGVRHSKAQQQRAAVHRCPDLNVSHALNKPRRRFLPNLHDPRFWVESKKRYVKLRVSSNGMRIIDKKGIDEVLKDVRAAGHKV